MQLPPQMLQLLRCPESHSELKPLDQEVVDQLNSAIQSKNLTNQIGKTVQDQLDGALINQPETWIYPIRDGIVCLIQDQAISATHLPKASL